MILTCNSCGKKFVVPDSAITASGRMVQCGSCEINGNNFQYKKLKKLNQFHKQKADQISNNKAKVQKPKKIKKSPPKKSRKSVCTHRNI